MSRNKSNEQYMLVIFTIFIILSLAYILGCTGCSKAESTAYITTSTPFYLSTPPNPMTCLYGGVDIVYNGNITQICHTQPPTSPDVVSYVDVCPKRHIHYDEREFAICINRELYGLHNNTSEFLIELKPGLFYSGETAYGCQFKVLDKCGIER